MMAVLRREPLFTRAAHFSKAVSGRGWHCLAEIDASTRLMVEVAGQIRTGR
jgi:hypothetical protein